MKTVELTVDEAEQSTLLQPDPEDALDVALREAIDAASNLTNSGAESFIIKVVPNRD